MTLEHKVYDAPELLGELLIFEIAPPYSRESVTVKTPATALPMGTLLVKNADGTFQAWTPTDADVAGILLRDVSASSSSVNAPAVLRGALVSASMLKWPADTAEEKKKAALAALETIGIIAR